MSSTSSASFWKCPQCTYHNAQSRSTCEMCDHTLLKKNKSSTFSSTVNGIGQTVNGLIDRMAAKMNSSSHQPVGSMPSHLSSPQIHDINVWTCPRCTFSQNPSWSRCCDACSFDPADDLQPQVVPAAPPLAPVRPKLTPRPDTMPSSSTMPSAPMLAPSASSTGSNRATNNNNSSDISPELSSKDFLIEDYDAQLHIALADWQTIVANNSSSLRQYVDPGFSPSLDSILYDPSKPLSQSELFDSGQAGSSSTNIDARKIYWKRPYETSYHGNQNQLWGWLMDHRNSRSTSAWTVFRSPMPSDIHQGVLGNCWLVSALSLIACEPLLLHKIFITPDFQPTGAYALRLCIDGRWRVIIIDDVLPCYGSSGRLLFSKSTRNQLWVPLIEKAMAKAHGCYESLAGGHTYEGLSALTGEAVETFVLPDENRSSKRETLEPEDIWIKLVSYLDSRFLIGVSCGREAISEEVYQSIGLIKNHAYSVLAVHSSINPTDGKPLRLVRLRNPWGTSDWKGDWSDSSSAWSHANCPPDVKNQLAPYGQSEGVFWMSFQDFLFYFENLDVCKVRPDWREYRITASFLRPPAESAVVALITVVETTQIELMLHQHGLRQKSKVNRSAVDLFLMLCSVRRDGSTLNPGKVIGTSGGRRLDAFTQAGEFLVQPGEYAVVALSFHAACSPEHGRRSFTLSIHSAKPLVVDPVLLPRSFLVDAFIAYVRTFGKKYYGPGEIVVSYVTERFSGLALLVDNGSSAWHVKIDCDCDGSENVVSTRSILRSIDHLPANSCQLVQVLTPLEPRQRWHVVHHLKHVATSIPQSNPLLFRLQAPPLPPSDPPIPNDLHWLHAPRKIIK